MGKFLAWFLCFWLVVGGALGAKEGGTLVYARGADGSSMDPALVTDGESYAATANIYETLVQFKYGSTEIEPALASSWEISKDGLVYTFHLRQGVYFHTTKYWNKKVELTSKDVLFSFKRQMRHEKPYYKEARSYGYWESMGMSNIIKSIEAPDKYTIKFTLKHPEAPFLADLGMDFLSILSEDYAQELAKSGRQDQLSKKPIGTGPFKLALWLKDERIVLVKNQEYWGTKAHLNQVVLKVIPNPSSRTLALQKGEVHIVHAPNPNEVRALEKSHNIVVEKVPGLFVTWLSLNNQKKPFNNRLVRLALNYGINVDEYVKIVYEGYASRAINPLPPDMWGYDKNIKPYPYDPAKAKALLRQAGYPNGFETTLFSSSRYNKKGAEFIQAQLGKIGIKVKIEFFEWGTYIKKTALGEHTIAFSGWQADTGDPDNFLDILWSKHAASEIPSRNSSFYKSDGYSDLVTKAKRITDEKERAKLYYKAQEIFHKDVPAVLLAYPYVIVPHLASVKGYKATGVQLNRFVNVYFDK
ncbi:ABC transporter substrate-binding protein [Helicobacter bizzozeronii]|uniref:ABC transporter substrate-binding protein n=1 Tax=Helicobacter bizzozeronii TaxID=56877 RepID=UPI001F3BE38D|nr:ABC transporter substrate-binding protein [Helicobacter bizzozeronii]